MNSPKLGAFLLFLVLGLGSISAQHPDLSEVVFTETIQNGSFGGQTYDPSVIYSEMPPEPWIWCNRTLNTPDHQPGNFDITVTPYRGLNYVGMVSKFGVDSATYSESIAAPIRFQKGKEQFIVFYLANNKIQYRRGESIGGRLRILIRQYAYCPEEDSPVSDTIWTSPLIKGEIWQPQFVSFVPSIEEGFLIFEALPGIDEKQYIRLSNILIDAISGPFLGSFSQPDLGEDRTICRGDSVIMALPQYGPSVKILWSDGDTSARKIFTEPGTYHVTVQHTFIQLRDTVEISVLEPFELELGEDQVICEQSGFEFGPDAPEYQWTWGDGWEGSPRPLTQSGSYTLQGRKGECVVEDAVNYVLEDCTVALEMPNVFSPNGDGINDIFRPIKADNLLTYQLTVYDRWGRPIFESSSSDVGWNGQLGDQGQGVEGVYFWSVVYKNRFSEEVKAEQGNVTLLR